MNDLIQLLEGCSSSKMYFNDIEGEYFIEVFKIGSVEFKFFHGESLEETIMDALDWVKQ